MGLALAMRRAVAGRPEQVVGRRQRVAGCAFARRRAAIGADVVDGVTGHRTLHEEDRAGYASSADALASHAIGGQPRGLGQARHPAAACALGRRNGGGRRGRWPDDLGSAIGGPESSRGPGWPAGTIAEPVGDAGRALSRHRGPADSAAQLSADDAPDDPAPLEPTDLQFPISLAAALRLADARPLIVAAAQASVWMAEADLTQARVLFIPMLNAAADYLRHDGGGPDFNKGIMTAPSVNFFYAGLGLWGFLNSTDAIFEPLVARQNLNARHWDVQTSKNDAVLQTADAYFRVHQYRGMYAGALYCVGQGHVLIEKLAALSRDLIPEFEVERARNFVADLEQRSVMARQQWRVQSANLTQLLRLDPRAVIVPVEPDHLQITLIEPGRTLEELMPIAMTNRPEIASRRASVQAATAAIRREKMRPVLPSVVLSGYQSPGGMLIQGGIFGLGPNSSLSQWVGRDDVSVQLVWQLDYLGFGNLAQIKRQRGQQSRATVDLFRAQDNVAADVNRAHARLQSAAVRVIQADRAMRHGHHQPQRQLRGPERDQPIRRPAATGDPAPGGDLRPPAPLEVLRRVLHHCRRIQPRAVRPLSRARISRPGDRRASAARPGHAGRPGSAPVPAPRGPRTAPGIAVRRRSAERGRLACQCGPGGLERLAVALLIRVRRASEWVPEPSRPSTRWRVGLVSTRFSHHARSGRPPF